MKLTSSSPIQFMLNCRSFSFSVTTTLLFLVVINDVVFLKCEGRQFFATSVTTFLTLDLKDHRSLDQFQLWVQFIRHQDSFSHFLYMVISQYPLSLFSRSRAAWMSVYQHPYFFIGIPEPAVHTDLVLISFPLVSSAHSNLRNSHKFESAETSITVVIHPAHLVYWNLSTSLINLNTLGIHEISSPTSREPLRYVICI